MPDGRLFAVEVGSTWLVPEKLAEQVLSNARAAASNMLQETQQMRESLE